MTRSFGKYRSRRTAKKSEPEKDEEPEPVQQKPQNKKPVKKPAKKKAQEPQPEKEIEPEEFSTDDETSTDDLEDLEEDSRRVGGGLLPSRLHVPKMTKHLLTKAVSVMDDHDFKGLKHGAKYILGHDTDVVHHHRHRATQHAKHFQQIARSTRQDLVQALHKGGEDLHRSVHEALHSAKLGGGFDFDHVIHIAKHIANPIGQLEKAKDQYDQINLNDTSLKGMVSNAGHAYSGNFHVASAHTVRQILSPPPKRKFVL